MTVSVKPAMVNQATVIATYGRNLLVENTKGARIICVSRGKKQQAVVGDQVIWQPSHDGGVIERVVARKNIFYRQDHMRTKVFAANIDLIIILVAVEPRFSARQLTKALIAAEQAEIPVLVALNKADLREKFATEKPRLEQILPAHVKLISFSVLSQPTDCVAQLASWLKAKHTLVVGSSGVGKSSLINLLVPQAQIKTAEISAVLNSGKHTTTNSTLYWLPDLSNAQDATGTAIIDTPGFQEFGLNHINQQQLLRCFPDLLVLIERQCKFANCSHIHEPECVLKENLLTPQLKDRYQQFLQLYAEIAKPR